MFEKVFAGCFIMAFLECSQKIKPLCPGSPNQLFFKAIKNKINETINAIKGVIKIIFLLI